MFYVYAISSNNRNYIYVDLSNNVDRRIIEYNTGRNKTTKPYAPFTLFHQKAFPTRPLARAREKYLKSGVSKEFLKNKLNSLRE